MSELFDTEPVSWITTGAVGEPGQRMFFLQGGSEADAVTLLLEKEQVDALSRHIQALLIRLGEENVIGPESTSEPAPELTEPVEPMFRVGQMALGYDAERDLILLQCEEYVAPEELDEDDDEDDEEAGEEAGEEAEAEAQDWSVEELLGAEEGTRARFWATRRQMRSLAARGVELVAKGRPRCRLCGQPIDPEGHFCAARNGHREIGEIR